MLNISFLGCTKVESFAPCMLGSLSKQYLKHLLKVKGYADGFNII